MILRFNATVRALSDSACGITIPQHLVKDGKVNAGQPYNFFISDDMRLYSNKDLLRFLKYLLEHRHLKEGLNYRKILLDFEDALNVDSIINRGRENGS